MYPFIVDLRSPSHHNSMGRVTYPSPTPVVYPVLALTLCLFPLSDTRKEKELRRKKRKRRVREFHWNWNPKEEVQKYWGRQVNRFVITYGVSWVVNRLESYLRLVVLYGDGNPFECQLSFPKESRDYSKILRYTLWASLPLLLQPLDFMRNRTQTVAKDGRFMWSLTRSPWSDTVS